MVFLRIGNGEMIMPFQPLVQFGGSLVEQKQAAGKHNNVFARYGKTAEGKERLGKRDNVCHKAQHHNAYGNGQR